MAVGEAPTAAFTESSKRSLATGEPTNMFTVPLSAVGQRQEKSFTLMPSLVRLFPVAVWISSFVT